MRKVVTTLLSLLLMFTANIAYAEHLRPLIETGIYFGGDRLVDVEFNDGYDESIDAGGVFDISGGFALEVDPTTDIQLSVGYRGDSVTAFNGSVDWRRYPIELKAFYVGHNFRLGAGVTYHMNPRLDSSGFSNEEIDFKNAYGFVGEVDHLWPFGLYLGLKFTAIDYEVDEPGSNEKVNGNSVGIVLGYMFH